MVERWKGHPLIPIVLGSAMLVVVIAAILPPNFEAGAVQSICPTGNCVGGGQLHLLDLVLHWACDRSSRHHSEDAFC